MQQMTKQFENSLLFRNEDAKQQHSRILDDLRIEKDENEALKGMVLELTAQLERAKINSEDLEHHLEEVVTEHERGRAEIEEQLQLIASSALSKETANDYERALA